MMIEKLKKWTVLKVYFVIYILCCVLFTILRWKTLSSGEGWGVVYMVGLISIGLFGLLVDLILTSIIKNKKLLNGIGIIIALIFSILLWTELN